MLVRAIRGATTVENNDSNEIIEETKSLLMEIAEKNNICEDDIISIVMSVTKDLNAAFPAVGARQIGWTNVALFCTNEMDVPGGLEKCIRVLAHINTDKSNKDIKHVYLKGARILRPDLVE
ncbi:MAG: chorismate mutase [Bacillota bacterium]|nr:chorismate mutase [Bacillota bacterium]